MASGPEPPAWSASSPRPPLFVLGVRRSGTTLLRVILGRHSNLAIPDESYFIPQLAERHRGRIRVEPFVDDLKRLPTLREWGVDVDAVRPLLHEGQATGDAIAAVFQTYAEMSGKARWGDKTPMYMQYLALLERLFPTARFVHLIRDGRNAALSFLAMPEGIATHSWATIDSAADFACQWQTEVADARSLGDRVGPDRYLEVRYEDLVAEPGAAISAVCSFLDLSYEPEMLDYAGKVDVSDKPHLQSLKRPPTSGLRDWRSSMEPGDVAAFEEVAGELLSRLGYPTEAVHRAPALRGQARCALFRLRRWGWRRTGGLIQRSPVWRRRHPVLFHRD